jgi:hypothetical protein
MSPSTCPSRHWLCWTLGFAAFVVLGCGESFPRHPVSGTVTYGGKTLAAGSITFEPTESVGKIAPTGMARIENGRFQTPRDQSPTTGRYVVRVVGHDPKILAEIEKNPNKEFVGTLDMFPPYELTVDIPPPGGELTIDVPAGRSGSR